MPFKHNMRYSVDGTTMVVGKMTQYNYINVVYCLNIHAVKPTKNTLVAFKE